jgi:hypothetical protein
MQAVIKMKTTLLIVSLFYYVNSSFGQADSSSAKNFIYRDSIKEIKQQKYLDSLEKIFYQQPNYLSIKIFKNNKETKLLKKRRVQLFSNKVEISRVDTTNKILFPKVDQNAVIQLQIKDGKELRNFSGLGKEINMGGDLYFVTISNFNKVLSVAEENNMEINMSDYKTYRSRFFIANYFTIDLPEFEKIRKVNFVIFKPRTYGDGTYITSIENIKYKN